MAKPSAEELELIQQLRDKVSNLGLPPTRLTDHELVRWIRARNNDVEKAEEMLRKSTAWRKENGMDELASWTPPKPINDNWNYILDGFDSENSPILISYAGQAKMLDLLSQGLKNDMIKFCLRNYELNIQRTEGKLTSEGYPVSQVILITDYTGLPMSALLSIDFSTFWIELVKLMEENYPNTLKQLIGMNSGSIMSGLLKITRPFLSNETANRTLMCSQNPHKFRKQHLLNIPADQLCARFGGTKRCEQNFCCNVEGKQEHINVSIQPHDKFEVPVEIKKPTSVVLYWSFTTKRLPIQFGVTTNSGEVVIPREPVDSQKEKIQGSLYCENTGKYTLEFYNDDQNEAEELEYAVTTVGG